MRHVMSVSAVGILSALLLWGASISKLSELKLPDNDAKVLIGIQTTIENINYKLRDLIAQAVSESKPETQNAIKQIQQDAVKAQSELQEAFTAALKRAGADPKTYGIDLKAKLIKPVPK